MEGGIETFSREVQLRNIPLEIEAKESEIIIVFSEEQSVNANEPTDLTEDGIIISVNELQFLKASSSIFAKEEGNEIFFRDEQLKNIPFENEVREDTISIVIELREEQSANANEPIISIEAGIVNSVNAVQFLKASSTIFVNEKGNEICFRDEQLANALY